jgi:hypothetical protein
VERCSNKHIGLRRVSLFPRHITSRAKRNVTQTHIRDVLLEDAVRAFLVLSDDEPE